MFKASTDGQELQKLSRDIDDMCKFLSLQINTSTLEAIQRSQAVSAAPIPPVNNDAGKTSPTTCFGASILPSATGATLTYSKIPYVLITL